MSSKLITSSLAVATVGFILFRSFLQRNKPKHESSSHGALRPGRVAVITGASSGIGLATAKACAAIGMKVVLVDIDVTDLQHAQEACAAIAKNEKDIHVVATDVRELTQVEALKAEVYHRFGEVAFLFNNAGIGGGAGPYEKLKQWHEVIQTNLWGVVHGVHVFTPAMIAQGTPCVIVNTGSKQGITTPPGDTAYNISKSGVKILTEGLEHKLRNTPNCKVNSFLLIPGWVNTSIKLKANKRLDVKDDPKSVSSESNPAKGAWMPQQVVTELFKAINNNGPFYIICPDYEMSNDFFNFAIDWSAQDIIQRRPPLSRWFPGHKEEFSTRAKGL